MSRGCKARSLAATAAAVGLVGSALGYALPATAQAGAGAPIPTADPAGATSNRERNIERYYRERREDKKIEPPTDPIIGDDSAGPSAEDSSDSSTRFLLKGIEFSASELLTQKTLEGIASPYVGKRVTLADINRIVDEINAQYVARNIVTAKAILPPQRVTDGVVRIRLVEGRLGEVEIEGNKRLRDGFIRGHVDPEIGALVDGGALSEQITSFNRIYDARLQALMRPGQQPGLTDILLLAQEPPLIEGSLFTDNAGSDSTGRYRTGATLRLNNLIGVEDRLDVFATASKGAESGFASYSLPVTPWDTRIGVSYSKNDIELQNGAFQQLDITGESETTAVNLTQPLVATRDWLVTAAGSWSRVDSSTDVADIRISTSETTETSLGVTLSHRGPAHRMSVTPTFSRIESAETLENDDEFYVYDAIFSGLFLFGESPYSLRFVTSVQVADSDLLPSVNLFQIGGVGTVRGYEQAVVSGPEGYFGNLELHRGLTDWLEGYVFVDHGKVFSAFPENIDITSAGVGAAFYRGDWLSGNVDLGFPFDTVTPDQDSARLSFRIAVSW